MRTVKFNGAPIKEPLSRLQKAEIQGQGSIPYAQAEEVATPNTEFAKITTVRSVAWAQQSEAVALLCVENCDSIGVTQTKDTGE